VRGESKTEKKIQQRRGGVSRNARKISSLKGRGLRGKRITKGVNGGGGGSAEPGGGVLSKGDLGDDSN